MILLTVRDLSRQFDVDPVFRDVTFDVRAGEKIGLVGPNGTGKTTLLKILAGHDEPDTGQIETHSGSTRALLEQDARFDPGRTLIEEAKSGLAHLYELQHQALAMAEQMAQVRDEKELDRLHKRYDDLQHELEKHDAYHIDHRVDEVLSGLGFTPDEYDRPLCQFSGGQQNRVLLARLLLRAPDVMLLDEPTNHLDIAATEWLEVWLSKCEHAVILVSHDRYFLDRVTTRILEMHQARVTDFKGNFSAYWLQREERAKVLDRTYEKQQEFIAKTEDFIRRNKYGQKHAQASDREKNWKGWTRSSNFKTSSNLRWVSPSLPAAGIGSSMPWMFPRDLRTSLYFGILR
jgi:ATP-binding cassette subfamily F protein 3